MRARIHKRSFRLEFDGAPGIWNDFLRPIVGGPEAPPDVVQPAQVADAGGTFAAASFPSHPGSAPAAAVHAQGAPAPVVRTYAPAAAAPAPTRPAGRTWFPPRGPAAPVDAPAPGRRGDDDDAAADGPPHDRNAPWRRRGGPEPEIRVEPSNDPKTLYARLDAMGSRRAEKDAVVAAVWFVGQDQREVHEREAAKHLAEHGGPTDVKIRPHFLKHITRTKLLEPGTQPGLVRLSRKGREQIRLLCGV